VREENGSDEEGSIDVVRGKDSRGRHHITQYLESPQANKQQRSRPSSFPAPTRPYNPSTAVSSQSTTVLPFISISFTLAFFRKHISTLDVWKSSKRPPPEYRRPPEGRVLGSEPGRREGKISRRR
jgi:hypothetical protein